MSDQPLELSPEALATWQQEQCEYREYLKKQYPDYYEVKRLREALLEVVRMAQWPEGGSDVGRKVRLNTILWHSLNALGIKPGDSSAEVDPHGHR